MQAYLAIMGHAGALYCRRRSSLRLPILAIRDSAGDILPAMRLKKWDDWSRLAKWSGGFAAATIVSVGLAFGGGGGPCGMGGLFFYLGVVPGVLATCVTTLVWVIRSLQQHRKAT